MAMIPETDAATLAALLFGVGLFLVAAGAFAFRGWRIRRAEARLAMPASAVADLRARKRGRPGWVKRLPKDLDLELPGSLFDALYAHFAIRPDGLVPSALSVALGESRRPSTLAHLAPDLAPMSEEERIKSLLSAPTEAPVAPPAEAFTQNFVLNLINVFRGRKKLKQGLEHAVLDSLTPGGGFAGAKIGGAVGLTLAPFTAGLSTVFVPASVAAGAWLGSWTGKKVGTRIKARQYFSALKRLRVVSRDFQRWFVARFPDFLRELDREYHEAEARIAARETGRRGRWARTFSPDLLAVFHRRARSRLREDRAADRRRFKQIFSAIRARDPLDFASVLERMNARTLETHPEFGRYRQEYRTALRDFRELRKDVG